MAVRERVQAPESTEKEAEDDLWLQRLVGPQLMVSKGADGFVLLPTSDCKGKHVLFYVSAKWCPPCRKFTPLLQEFYAEMKKSGNHDLEIIFISLDREESQHKVHHAWLNSMQYCMMLLFVSYQTVSWTCQPTVSHRHTVSLCCQSLRIFSFCDTALACAGILFQDALAGVPRPA
jgi:thiol-disulfide isomerase/thioredoxin